MNHLIKNVVSQILTCYYRLTFKKIKKKNTNKNKNTKNQK